MQYDVVVFLDVDWDLRGIRNRQHFLIREIARQVEGKGQVLALERPVCPVTGPSRRRAKFVDWFRGRRGLRQEAPNLFLYTPFIWLHNVLAASVPGLTRANRRLLRRQINGLMDRLRFRRRDLVAWIHHPYQLQDMDLVGERLLLYDCYDDYVAAQGNPVRRHDVHHRERQILACASIVLVSSEKLLKAKRKSNENVHLVPNGVEYEHFAQAASSAAHSSLAPPGRSVLGFTGRITDRLDFALLSRLAQMHPDWQFVFIGSWQLGRASYSYGDWRPFFGAPNVRLTGAKPYQQLPLYMQEFDVCLLPYAAENPFNAARSPLKLYEYLATGKPIVSTDLPGVRPFDGLVRIARNEREFEQHVVAALLEQDQDLRQLRFVEARQQSWQKRASTILDLIADRLAEPKA